MRFEIATDPRKCELEISFFLRTRASDSRVEDVVYGDPLHLEGRDLVRTVRQLEEPVLVNRTEVEVVRQRARAKREAKPVTDFTRLLLFLTVGTLGRSQRLTAVVVGSGTHTPAASYPKVVVDRLRRRVAALVGVGLS